MPSSEPGHSVGGSLRWEPVGRPGTRSPPLGAGLFTGHLHLCGYVFLFPLRSQQSPLENSCWLSCAENGAASRALLSSACDQSTARPQPKATWGEEAEGDTWG